MQIYVDRGFACYEKRRLRIEIENAQRCCSKDKIVGLGDRRAWTRKWWQVRAGAVFKGWQLRSHSSDWPLYFLIRLCLNREIGWLIVSSSRIEGGKDRKNNTAETERSKIREQRKRMDDGDMCG